jgi:hypothetical protein
MPFISPRTPRRRLIASLHDLLRCFLDKMLADVRSLRICFSLTKGESMRAIRTSGARLIKLIQTKVEDKRYKVAIAIHLFRSGATCAEMAWMLLTIPAK